MIGRLGAQLALLAFAGAIVAGLSAGNTAATVLTRALLAMGLALLVGQLVGWSGKLVLRDHLQSRKALIDREHLEALARAKGAAEPDGAAAAPATR